jgi:hypothetical protein
MDMAAILVGVAVPRPVQVHPHRVGAAPWAQRRGRRLTTNAGSDSRVDLEMSSRQLAGLAAVAVALLALTAPANADAEHGPLVMDGHAQGHIIYSDRCSNGANSDPAGFDDFVTALRGDPKSQLARTLAETEKKFVTDKTFYEVALGDWIQTYHLRDGCSDTSQSFSAIVFVRSKMGNSHELWTKFVVTIDDDVSSDRRTFKVRSVLPLALREQ